MEERILHLLAFRTLLFGFSGLHDDDCGLASFEVRNVQLKVPKERQLQLIHAGCRLRSRPAAYFRPALRFCAFIQMAQGISRSKRERGEKKKMITYVYFKYIVIESNSDCQIQS